MQNPWGRAKCQIKEKTKEHSEKSIELLFWTMAILDSKIEEMNKKSIKQTVKTHREGRGSFWGGGAGGSCGG